MLAIGTPAPNFELPDPTGKNYQLGDFKDQSLLLVVFICNHCPFVVQLKSEFSAFVKEYADKGLATVAINSNDVENYPDDSPEKMLSDIKEFDYSFPYLIDESQEVAKAYRAACTPDFFLFNSDRKLIYRGRFDGASPGNNVKVTGNDLRRAVDLALKGDQVPEEEQTPSIGCNIKWKPGAAPAYFSS